MFEYWNLGEKARRRPYDDMHNININVSFKDNKLVQQTPELQQKQDRLHFLKVLAEHAGTYMCLAENEAGQGNYSYRLDVLSPPRILGNNLENISELDKDKMIELTVGAGELFEVECLAIGKPIPQVSLNMHFYNV